MASSKNTRLGIQIVLGIIIVVLAYVLYESITEPYEELARQQRTTELTRERMDDIRQALIMYERDQDTFPGTLDSLAIYLNAHEGLADSLFGAGFPLDSMGYSPRSGEPFNYAVNDTGSVDIYLLEDPDSEDKIGSLEPQVTMVNAASWE